MKAIILLTIFVDVVGFGIVVPILPYYVAEFSSSSFVITALFSAYAFCSFLSAPLIGALSDKYGRRPLLVLSIFSTALGWIIFSLAPSVLFLFLGRIIDGLAAGNFSLAQSILSDISKDSKERTANFGMMGAVFGIGFIVGPLLGGLLGSFGHTVPFWFVAGLAMLNTLSAYLFLPETHTQRSTERISMNPFTPLVRAIHAVHLRTSYVSWLLFGLAIAGFQSVFALYVQRLFGFTAFMTGMAFTGIGMAVAINQGVVMKHVWLKYFKEPDLELCVLLGFCMGFLLLSTGSFPLFVLGLICITFGQSILRVVMISQIVGQTGPQARGEVLGVTSSLSSLSMGLAPLIAGVLFEWKVFMPFLLSAIWLFAAFVLLYRKRKMLSQVSLIEDLQETLL